jgi:hypothetical protein
MRFLVLKREIEKALFEERSLKRFYELNKDRPKLGYLQLCRYARAFKLREATLPLQACLWAGNALDKAASQKEVSPAKAAFPGDKAG